MQTYWNNCGIWWTASMQNTHTQRKPWHFFIKNKNTVWFSSHYSKCPCKACLCRNTLPIHICFLINQNLHTNRESIITVIWGADLSVTLQVTSQRCIVIKWQIIRYSHAALYLWLFARCVDIYLFIWMQLSWGRLDEIADILKMFLTWMKP